MTGARTLHFLIFSTLALALLVGCAGKQEKPSSNGKGTSPAANSAAKKSAQPSRLQFADLVHQINGAVHQTNGAEVKGEILLMLEQIDSVYQDDLAKWHASLPAAQQTNSEAPSGAGYMVELSLTTQKVASTEKTPQLPPAFLRLLVTPRQNSLLRYSHAQLVTTQVEKGIPSWVVRFIAQRKNTSEPAESPR